MRMFTFLGLITTILSLTGFYLFSSLGTLWIVLPLVIILITPLIYWVGEREVSTRLDEWVQLSSFIAMGFVSFLMIFALLKDLVLFRNPTADVNGLVYICTFVATSFALWNAQRMPNTKSVNISLAHLPTSLKDFKILQISDLHIGPTLKKRGVQKLVDHINTLEFDVLVLTGDIIDGDVSALKDEVALLSSISAPHGKYLVLGNHEYYWDPLAWIQEFKRSGFNLLLNEGVHLVPDLWLAGVTDWAALHTLNADKNPVTEPPLVPRPPLAHSGRQVRVLLAHQPKIAQKAALEGYDLMLSGHTHGGQFHPWTWIARLVHPLFLGHYKIKDLQVYISAGTGSWGPPFRWGTRTELSLIKLTS